MRFTARVATVIGASVARATRYAVTALALGLVLQGSALCLCTPRPARNANADPHSCCPKPAGHDTAKTPKAAVKSADGCCASQMSVPDVVARIEAREPVRQPLTFVAAPYIPPAAPAAPSTFGASAFFVRAASAPLTPVLRI